MGLYSGLTVETTLDPAKQPFLFDHQINRTPVLPGVMGLEAMAETAKLLFPDRHIGAIEDVSFMTPFKFYRNQPRTLTIHASFSAGERGHPCVLPAGGFAAASRAFGAGNHHPFHWARAFGSTAAAGRKRKSRFPSQRMAPKRIRLRIYRVYFHGPAYQVIDSAWRAGGNIIASFAKNLPANHEPSDLPVSASPRFVELCFQTASLAGLARQSRLGLPYAFRELTVVSIPEKELDAAFFSAVATNPDGTYDAKVIDGKGKVYLILRGYQTMDLPDPVSADLLQPIKQALQA